MKLPRKPPSIEKIVESYDAEKLLALISHSHISLKPVTDSKEYIHWDKLRHLKPPTTLSSEEWWFTIKWARKLLYKPLPFNDIHNKAFVFGTPDPLLYKLSIIDRAMGNSAQANNSVLNTQIRDTYLVNSLIEESITSSQLEGAVTTRNVAKEMLRSKRKPKNISEQMILNNYHAMQFMREIKNEALTPHIVMELHRIVSLDTLEEKRQEGHFRTAKDDISIVDVRDDEILHIPPNADELPERLQKLCGFANARMDDEEMFIHPVIKAIVLHFILAYDHPFVDGNGRTARALFYWSMLHQGYWLTEFISISNILKKAPAKYGKAYLYTETDDNDVTYFLFHQIEVILDSIQALHQYLDKKTNEIQEAEALLHTPNTLSQQFNFRQLSLIRHALRHPQMHYEIKSYQQSHNITYDTARTDLLKLVDFGLLVKQKIGKKFVFVASIELRKQLE
ncbi:MAG: Fic family protein [Gammaproteobacteria bacterium]|nr:Fic family protein [Gammaproteobacteria bacterium]